MDKFPLQMDKELDDMGYYQESTQFRLGVSFFAALLTASTGYPIGRNWKVYEYIYNNSAYYIDAFFNWLMIYMVLEYIYYVSGVLDKSTPWKEGWKLRMSLQIFVAVFGAMFFMEFYSETYFQMTDRSLLRIPNNVFQMPLSIIWAVPYSFYCCIRSLHEVYMKEIDNKEVSSLKEIENKPDASELESPIIALRDGKSIFLLDVPLALIVYDDGINKIYPLDPEEEILKDNRSLSFLYGFLDQHQYKRGGRDYIINREIVKEYKAQADGNILLVLNYPSEERLYVSKGQTEDFIQ